MNITRIVAVLFCSLGIQTSLKAADNRFCDHYAQTAVKQQVANIAEGCGGKGLRWSPLYVEQNAWCRTVRQTIANNETKERNKVLTSCGTDIKKIDWSNLSRRTLVWDELFDLMKEAAKKDDVIAVKVMHPNGVSIHHQYGFNYAAILYHAVDLQAEKTSEYLLSQGADPQIIPNGGGNALAKMLENPKVNYRMLAMLLKNGFDPNYGGEGYVDEYFPMMVAAKKNDLQAMQILLKAGGDPNLVRDATPLIYAIRNRNQTMIRLLIESGAKPNLAGGFPMCSPMDEATKTGSQSIINYMKANGAKPSGNC